MKKQNMILTSMLALVIATPAMAAVGDVITTGASCTINDLGVSSGTANATAQFQINTYNCAAGTYLPAGDDWETDDQGCTTCPENYYCTAGNRTYNQTTASGASACPAAYPSSDAGTGNQNQCYVSASCPTISATTACDPHADTCAYTNDAVTTGRGYRDGSATTKCSLDFTCATGYTKSTTQSAPTLPSTATNGTGYQYRSHLYPNGGSNSNNDNDLSAGEWKVAWTSGATQGTMKGIASCNTVLGNNDERTSTLPANTNLASNSADANDSSRRYCWCKPTSWTPSGGSEQLLSAAWVFLGDFVAASNCADVCADSCANRVYSNAGFRSALFGVVGASSQCVANTIDINWKNENGTVFTTDQCIYDESLTVPSTHPDKRGYTFTGWKFVSPSQN